MSTKTCTHIAALQQSSHLTPTGPYTPFTTISILYCINLHPHSQYRMLLSVKSRSLQHTGHSTSSSSLVDAISSLAYQLHYTIPLNRLSVVLYSIYTMLSFTFAPPSYTSPPNRARLNCTSIAVLCYAQLCESTRELRSLFGPLFIEINTTGMSFVCSLRHAICIFASHWIP